MPDLAVQVDGFRLIRLFGIASSRAARHTSRHCPVLESLLGSTYSDPSAFSSTAPFGSRFEKDSQQSDASVPYRYPSIGSMPRDRMLVIHACRKPNECVCEGASLPIPARRIGIFWARDLVKPFL